MTLKAAVVFGAGGTANNWVVDDFASINGQQFVKLGRELIYDVSAKWNTTGSNTITATSDVRGGVYLSAYKVVLSVEVPLQIVPDAGMVGSLGDMVPSNNGDKGEKHFVSPPNLLGGSDGNYLTFRAEGITATQFQNLLQWDGGEAVAGDPLKRRVPRSSAGKAVLKVVTKTDTKEVAKLNAWVVSTSVSRQSSTPPDLQNSAGGAQMQATVVLKHAVSPASIATDPDRPDLTGSVDGAPGGTTVCDLDLAGGANSRWDVSRQGRYVYVKNRNFVLETRCVDEQIHEFPTDHIVGNDDAEVRGELNDPSAGYLTDEDNPSRVARYDQGLPGDSVQFTLFFREFTRLKIGGTWYRISPFFSYQVDFAFRKVASQAPSGTWEKDENNSRWTF